MALATLYNAGTALKSIYNTPVNGISFSSILSSGGKAASAASVANNINGVTGVATVAANLLSGIGESKKARSSARQYEDAAKALDIQSAGLLDSAKLYARSAEMSKEAGEANAREIVRQAGTIDPQKQFQIGAVNLKRRAGVDAGRTTYASQGILLEARDGAAVAMWEQDEVADAVLEKLNVMQEAEDQVYSYLVKAKDAKIQGLYQAAQSYGNAMQTAGQAQEAINKAIEYRRIASQLRKSSKGGLFKSIATAAVATVAGIATGGLGFAAAGTIAGTVSTVGSVIPTY